MISPGRTPSMAAMASVTRAISARAACPAQWLALGLPIQACSVRQKVSSTAGSAGVLAE